MGVNHEWPNGKSLAFSVASHDSRCRGGAPKAKIGRDCNVQRSGSLLRFSCTERAMLAAEQGNH
jgi:hypothetical protein